MPVEDQVVSIYAGVNGYLDKLPVRDVQRFEGEFLNELKANAADILTAIRDSGVLSDETEGKLKAVLDDFVKKFA